MHPIYQVDAFTNQPCRGNPAAVCWMQEPAEALWMQDVAGEMNLSETAFVAPAQDGAFNLRWFTPTVEVDLCGHATLASAHILWETHRLPLESAARFHTRSGMLTCTYESGWIEMDFPALPAEPVHPAPQDLLAALGVERAIVGRSKFDYLVQVESETAVRQLKPNMTMLRQIESRGVIVTAESSNCDFVSRFFAPQSGIDEDPVTGSSHCTLAPWWATRLGKQRMTAFQVSARGGTIRVEIAGPRVLVAGQAVTILRGELLG